MDIVFEKQKRQYAKVNRLYLAGDMTILDACDKAGICGKTYYTIKSKIQKMEGGAISNNNNGNNKKTTNSKQKGGNISSNLDITNGDNTDDDINNRIQKKFNEQSKAIAKAKKK